MRILILTDSTSLPKKSNQGVVKWEEIYPNLLRQRYPEVEVIHFGLKGGLITAMLSQLLYFRLVKPEIVIIQCGLSDCTPKALTKLELEFVYRFRLFRIVKPLFRFLRKNRNITAVSYKEFDKALRKFKERLPESKIFSLSILKPNHQRLNELYPGLERNIVNYNGLFKKHTEFIDLSFLPQHAFHEDLKHLNKEGHKLIFETIEDKLSPIVENRQVSNLNR